MQEQWKFIPGFPNYEISNLGEINRIGKTKKIPVKVSRDKNYVYASLSYEPYKSKQVSVKSILDELFDEHIYKDHSLDDLEGEVWRDVVGWEPYYEVSNLGRIKTKERSHECSNGHIRFVYPKLKETYFDEDGYERVCLYFANSSKLLGVHRLVAEAFIPNPDNLPQVNHKDDNKANNRVDNLEWMTNTENIRHSIQIGIRTPGCKPVVRHEDNKEFSSIAELNREIGGSYHDIVHQLKKSNGKYICINGKHYKYSEQVLTKLE